MDPSKFPKIEDVEKPTKFDLSDLNTPSVLTQIKAIDDSMGKVQFKAVYGNEDFVTILENGTVLLVTNPMKGIFEYLNIRANNEPF